MNIYSPGTFGISPGNFDESENFVDNYKKIVLLLPVGKVFCNFIVD